MSEEQKAAIVTVERSAQTPGEVALALKAAGYQVLPTSSLEEALRVIPEEQPDLVVMGPSLPDAEGLTLARTIKQDPALAHTPILFVSAAGEEAVERLAEVADAYLTAPLDPLVLRLNVRALLRLHAAEETRSQTFRLLQAVEDAFPWWLAHLDQDLVFVQVSPAFCEAVGKPPEALVGRHYTEVFPESELIARRVRRVLAAGKAIRLREVPYHAVTRRRRTADRYLDVSLVPVTDEAGAVAGVIFSALEVSAEVRLRAARAEEETRRRELAEAMNQEINHRIKNNLMTVAELLYFQAQSLPDASARAALDDAVSRLNVFARIHEQLQSVRTGEVDLLDLLHRVAAVSRSTVPEREVEVSVHGEAVSLPIQAATNLALATNELITNGIKHGALDAEGRRRIVVWLDHQAERVAVLVWSSGNPVPVDFDPTAQGGMGLHLVEAMITRHYGGSFTLCPDRGGTVAQVVVSERDLRER